MLPVCSKEVRLRLIPVLNKAGLMTEHTGNIHEALSFISHDKKCDGTRISVIFVDEIGSYRIEKMDASDFISHVLKELK